MTGDTRHDEHRRVWHDKPVLRRLYEIYYREILGYCRPGLTLEIGGGSGNLKEFATGIISTDIVFEPWLDAVADAHALPFRAASFDNIVLFDVLHHLAAPVTFFEEAQRLLKPGGRLVMVEPTITPLSGIVYRCFHPEPVVTACDPLAVADVGARRDPWDANQAIPTLLFFRDRVRFQQRFPKLRLRSVRRVELLAYPLSGGFRRWSLLPTWLVGPLCAVEEYLEPMLGWLMAFRLIAVLERLP